MQPVNLSELLAAAEASVTHAAAAWLAFVPNLQVFMRVQYYILDTPKVEHVVTVANVVVRDEYQRQGIFTRYLEYVEAATDKPIVIENVHNPFLHAFLLRRGYSILEKDMQVNMTLSYFKRKLP